MQNTENNKNPDNSSFIQMLLDAQSKAIKLHDNDKLLLVTQLLDSVEHDKAYRTEVDDTFNGHRYNSSKMAWYKRYNSINNTDTAIIDNLSDTACKLFNILSDNMNCENRIALGLKAGKAIGFNQRNFDKAVKELECKGYIRVVKKHSKANATIYELSTQRCAYGEYSNIENFSYKDDEGNTFTILDQNKGINPHIAKRSLVMENGKTIFYNEILPESD